jgi:hypothetical protein
MICVFPLQYIYLRCVVGILSVCFLLLMEVGSIAMSTLDPKISATSLCLRKTKLFSK